MRRHAKAATAEAPQGEATTVRRAGDIGAPVRDLPARLLLTLLAALGLCALSATFASAATVDPPPYFSSFGPDGTSATEFQRPGPIAVDQADHVVYVIEHFVDSQILLKFDSDGNPVSFGGSSPNLIGNELTGLTYDLNSGFAQVAVDSTSHDFYVTSENSVTAFHADGEPAEFTAGPGAGTNKIGGFGRLAGVAVDGSGNIFASDLVGGVVKIYSPSGEPITEFAVEDPANLAVDSRGVVYVNRFTFGSEKVWRFQPSEPSVTATTTYTPAAQPLSGRSSLTVSVDPAANDVYVVHTNPAEIGWYDEDGRLLATFAGLEEEGEIDESEGVAVDGADGKVFATNRLSVPTGCCPGQVEIFWLSPAPPQVNSISVADVTSASATLLARINPRRTATAYRFEYGPGDCSLGGCTSVPASSVGIGAGAKSITVAQDLAGLQPNTTYHYRVIAVNALGDNLAEGDHTFRTQPASFGFGLIDSRAWEMVSPLNKHGGLLDGSQNAQIQAAADGQGLVYSSRGTIESDPLGNRAVEAATILARRGTGGWNSKELTLPNDRVTGVPVGNGGEYKLFSRDLSFGLVEPRSAVPLSPQATERTPYLRENTEPPAYTPLLTEANVTSGAPFGGDPTKPLGPVRVVAATPDLSKVVLRTSVPLVEGAPSGFDDNGGLYLWAAGQLQPVNVLPAGEGGGFVAGKPQAGSGGASTRHAISDDGSRVFWSANLAYEPSNALYLRDTEAEETVRIDVPEPGATEAGGQSPVFQGASADGTVVFFTDTQQLTAGASPSGPDLYRCELPAGSPVSGCTDLVDLSAPLAGSGESAEVQGIAPGLGDDGKTIYLVAKGVLDTVPNESGEAAAHGKMNLYAWEQGSGVRFVAVLSTDDARAWGSGGVTSLLSSATSPGGRYLSFMSQRPLDGSDNLDAASGEPVQRVFRYDAVADRLDCVSCDPTGAAPDGVVHGRLGLTDPGRQWEGRLVGAILPQPTMTAVGTPEPTVVSLYSPRAVLDNGRIFFNSFDSLVPADSNGQWDVYQYEPLGTGGCTEDSNDPATAQAPGGCVSLLSSGTAEEEAGFLDAGQSGDDVFFLTTARLNEVDEDEELDVYDARVNGVPSLRPSRAECLGEACQPPVSPPANPTPASTSFRGTGNVKSIPRKRCPKGKRAARHKGKARCVARKHRGQAHGRRAGR